MSDLATAAAVDGSKSESQTSQAATGSDSGSVGDEVRIRPTWLDQAKGDLKDNPKFSQYETMSDQLNGYLELDGRLAKSITVPGEGASDDEVKTFRQRMGVPTESKDYALTSLEDLPDLGKFNDHKAGMADWFAPKALARGLTKEQASGVYHDWCDRVGEQLQEAEGQRQSAAKATKAVLQGELQERYEGTMNRANRLIKHVGGQELFDYLTETGLANDPRFIRYQMKLATMIGDDVLPDGEASGKQPWVSYKDGQPNMGYGPGDFKQT